MKKNEKLEVLHSEKSWFNSLEEHPFIQWAVDNGKALLYALIGLFLVSILIYRFVSASYAASETDFINAEKDYLIFSSPTGKEVDAIAQAGALNRLNKMISDHPELHAKYDGLLAEILLIRGENKQAKEFAESAIQRTSVENNPFYTSYAKTTLVITDGQYEQALKDAIALKDQMIKQGTELQDTPEKIQFSTLLYAFNLFRIGMLQQQLSLHAEELATWQDWKDLMNKSQNGTLPKYLDSQLFVSFDHLLTEGNLTFDNYIESRERTLNKS